MEINVLKQEKNKIEFEVLEEDHTFCNALGNKLWEDKDVEAAAYRIEHPLISHPVMLVQTKKGDPKKVLAKAVESLKTDIKNLRTCFKDVK